MSTTLTRRGWMAGAAGAASLRATTTKPLIIDAHCHAGLGQKMTAPWYTRASVDVTLRNMAEVGIDRTIIFPIFNDQYEKPNEEIARICRQHPGKFVGFAKHNPETEGHRIPALLRREVKELGLCGLKLHHQPTREVLDTVAELGIPILYHPPRVDDYHMIASEYPQIPFILAHLGSFGSYAWTEHYAAIDMARRYPNVYVDTSAVVSLKYIEMAVKELGPEKVIFGSDAPEADARVSLYQIRLLKLPPEDEAKVLGGNIQRLVPAEW